MFYPLSSNTWGEEEVAVFQEVLGKGRFTMGESVKKFESAFADKIGIKNALMVSSGSMANLVGLAALFYKKNNPLKRGDEVIVPSISWATTYYPLQQYGLKLKFLDVEIDTLNIDVSRLEEALTSKTRMVVAVSILGNPCALNILRKFCDRNGLYLFEDNCESMGATLDDKPCGTFGDIATFSTFFSHHISTMEGGIIVTKDEEIYHLAKSLRAHGWTRDIPSGTSIYEKGDDDFYEAYRFILPGYNARPLELSGALGIEQLKKLDSLLDIRRQNARLFVDLFADDERFIIQKENGSSSWFSFTIVLNPKISIKRSKVIHALRDAKIEFRIITGGCFLRHDVIRYFDYETVGNIVNANIIHDRGFFVGNHPMNLEPQIKKLKDVLDSATC
ncbi:MAG: DegT/DnrJ/EryC1/StrS family aminotransferase [Nitrospina sp.]|jgi:CDP-4-dehydro-6-deoxyglucose reductase, E1|nr:DegT/DnrJ/EryC1/StrS family aminotransferase [Nitrospina sp.]